MKIRRALLSVLSDAAYDTVQSFHSDSAVCFSVFLHHLPDLTSQHPPHVLLRAIEVLLIFTLSPPAFLQLLSGLLMSQLTRITSMCWHVRTALMSLYTAVVQATFASITAAQEEAGITEVSLLNFAMSDGSTLIATRYVSHEDEEPASLYYAEGSAFQRCPGAGQDPPTTPTVAGACKGPGKGAGEAGCVPCSPTANAASARNTAVAGEVRACFFT